MDIRFFLRFFCNKLEIPNKTNSILLTTNSYFNMFSSNVCSFKESKALIVKLQTCPQVVT